MVISFNTHSQSNRQRLSDIEDKLDELMFQQQLNEIDKLRKQNDEIRNSRPIRKEVYRNTDSITERNKQATFYNLSYSEYVYKDEVLHNRCDGSSIFHACYLAGMIGISLAELDKRSLKAIDKCSIGKGTQKEIDAMNACTRRIIILGK